jgi:chloramphenicol-sensitive protein RarD
MARTLPERAGGVPRTGLAAMACCFLIWAAYPFLFKALTEVGPLEIVAQRALWSAVALVFCLPFGGLRGEVLAALGNRRSMAVLLVTAVLIMANWLVYVLAVVQSRVLEASLGYFLGPLVSVAIGMVFLGERLRPGQWAAVAIALLAVLNLLLRQDHVPLIALFLALSFSSYGAIRKGLGVGPLAGMFVECLVALPFGLAALGWTKAQGTLVFGSSVPLIDLLLVIGGASTVLALSLFHFGAKRLDYTTVGLLGYVVPSWLFVAGVWIFGEPLDPARLVTFLLVWLALGIYTAEGLLRTRSGAG